MPLYISEEDPIFTVILEYRRAREDVLQATARGDAVPVDVICAYRVATMTLAEVVDKETRR